MYMLQMYPQGLPELPEPQGWQMLHQEPQVLQGPLWHWEPQRLQGLRWESQGLRSGAILPAATDGTVRVEMWRRWDGGLDRKSEQE